MRRPFRESHRRNDVLSASGTHTGGDCTSCASGKPYFTEALTVLTGARQAHARVEHTYLDNEGVILQENNFVACTETEYILSERVYSPILLQSYPDLACIPKTGKRGFGACMSIKLTLRG